jgi:hypothetical protein
MRYANPNYHELTNAEWKIIDKYILQWYDKHDLTLPTETTVSLTDNQSLTILL